MYMIVLERVTKRYGKADETPALDNVDLNINPREMVVIVGSSGSGKSTLLKMITREELPDEGKITVGGIDYDTLAKKHIPHLRRRIGVVFQDFKLLPDRTVYENVAFALEIAGHTNAETQNIVPRVLDLVGLLDKMNKLPAQLSGGEKQRVAIARSVARQPRILIADEPTGNLDNKNTWEIVDLVKKINDLGTTVLFTTHNLEIVHRLNARTVRIEDGKIVADVPRGKVVK
ncbi:cell division ATP-binding protein FtsE [Candidatus Saccharibacteria bacterium]|nr:cell division ATP-binding protein FtsE [Candidatus Saccharibacteria bacterium]